MERWNGKVRLPCEIWVGFLPAWRQDQGLTAAHRYSCDSQGCRYHLILESAVRASSWPVERSTELGNSCSFSLVSEPHTRLDSPLSFKTFNSMFTAFGHTFPTQSLVFVMKIVRNLLVKKTSRTFERREAEIYFYMKSLCMCVPTYLCFY